MLKMSGFELYKELKKTDEIVKVCFLTALSELHDYNALKNEVFPKFRERYYIQKPVENRDLLYRIREIIGMNLS
jgi:DNA-binding response OmpR family regulator